MSLRIMSILSLASSTAPLIHAFRLDSPGLLIDLGEWIHIKNSVVPVAIYLDRLGAGYLLLCDIILTLVIRFSTNYLIGDRGFKRFFVCIGLLRGGLGLVCLGGTVDALLIGWELVGICSVLLIGFFRHHIQAARNSWLSLCAYRIGDIGLILSVGLIHELGHGIHFDNFAASVLAPGGEHAKLGLVISALIIFGSLAKSGQFPLHWWIPRAMEGPSPSSAVFYGALSIHLGAFLLMRT
jgi:NADH-quinone oxidoreductase subunit L